MATCPICEAEVSYFAKVCPVCETNFEPDIEPPRHGEMYPPHIVHNVAATPWFKFECSFCGASFIWLNREDAKYQRACPVCDGILAGRGE